MRKLNYWESKGGGTLGTETQQFSYKLAVSERQCMISLTLQSTYSVDRINYLIEID